MPDKVRILCCHFCETVQEIPWCGEDTQCSHAQCNDALEYRVAEHVFGDGRPHAPANLADIEKKLWDKYSTRQDVLLQLKRIVDPGAGAGLGDSLYEVKSNYMQDASMCWKKEHNRTTDCIDFRHAKKRLVPDTKAERRDLGLETRGRHRPTNTYLCDFCPVRSIVEAKQQAAKGIINNPY